jgi:uncharacterized membrane protein YesL
MQVDTFWSREWRRYNSVFSVVNVFLLLLAWDYSFLRTHSENMYMLIRGGVSKYDCSYVK